MSWQNRNGVIVMIGLVLLISSAAASRPRKMQRLPTGTWGGPHIQMVVEAQSATIEYDCANGKIDGPLTVDSKGRFTWRGIHNREAFGHIRINEKPDSRPALYTGSVKGNTMTLTVKMADTNEVLETFTVKRGSSGRLHKCK